MTGRRLENLGHQPSPSIPDLAERLEREFGGESLRNDARRRVQEGQAWPHPVPVDLMAGLGFAQFAAACALLQQALGLDPTTWLSRVARAQPATAGDRRLLDEVPPHHGS